MAADYTSGLISYYKFSNDVTDSSGNGNDGTNNGTTSTTDKNGVANQAREFNGSSDIDVPGIDFNNAMSISVWFNINSINYRTLVGFNSSKFDTGLDVLVGGDIRFALRNDSGSRVIIQTNTGPISTGTWYHVVAWWDGTTMKIYLDDVEVASGSQSGTLNTVGLINTAIGSQRNDAYWDGKIDEVRFYARALDQNTRTGLYQGYDAPVASCDITSDLEHEYKASNNFNDTAGAVNGVNNGVTFTTDKNGVANQAFQFDALEAIQIDGVGSAFSGDWTVNAWFYATSITAGADRKYILDFDRSGGSTDRMIFSVGDNSDNRALGYFETGLGFASADAGFTINTWFMATWVKSGTTLTGYVDGVSLGVMSSSLTAQDCNITAIGSRALNTNINDGFRGKIDEIKIYSRALNQDSIDALYSGYDAPSCVVGGDTKRNGALIKTI